jgi:hypothetical protein
MHGTTMKKKKKSITDHVFCIRQIREKKIGIQWCDEY